MNKRIELYILPLCAAMGKKQVSKIALNNLEIMAERIDYLLSENKKLCDKLESQIETESVSVMKIKDLLENR